jgi:DNA-binding NarL/FixJ family response regulator
MALISVVIVANDLSHREALKNNINKVPHTFKVLDVVDLEKAAEKAAGLQPEVILCAIKDQEMPVSLLINIKKMCPQTALVVATERNDEDIIVDALKAGADACVVTMAPGYLNRVLELVCRGGVMVFPRMLKKNIQEILYMKNYVSPKFFADLTNRESEILDLLVKDKFSNKDIAERLFIAESTVKSHIRSIFRKTNIKSRVDLNNHTNQL